MGCGGGRVAGQVRGGATPAAAVRGCGSSGRQRGGMCRPRRHGTPLRDTPPPAARTLQHTQRNVRILTQQNDAYTLAIDK